jgi:hypothetical protein
LAKTSAIDKLPKSARIEIERRILAGETRRSIAEWAAENGYPLSKRTVDIFAVRVEAEVSQAKQKARDIAAIEEVSQVDGSAFSIGLIDRLELLYSQALMEIQPSDLISSMRLVDVLAAANRFSAIKIQEEAFKLKWSQEMSSKMDALKGKPGLSSETIRQLKGQLFGIYEDETDGVSS